MPLTKCYSMYLKFNVFFHMGDQSPQGKKVWVRVSWGGWHLAHVTASQKLWCAEATEESLVSLSLSLSLILRDEVLFLIKTNAVSKLTSLQWLCLYVLMRGWPELPPLAAQSTLISTLIGPLSILTVPEEATNFTLMVQIISHA